MLHWRLCVVLVSPAHAHARLHVFTPARCTRQGVPLSSSNGMARAMVELPAWARFMAFAGVVLVGAVSARGWAASAVLAQQQL
jgi:hypothetical protein